MTTLAERLGFAADDRLMLLNCDDLGSSHSANMACEAAMRRGFAGAATLMVPCPWAREAVERCADLDIGVHLTFTAEYPTYRWRALTAAASLHDEQGYMPAKAEGVWASASLKDVEAECRAQIDTAFRWGIDVSHLDTHMGVMQLREDYCALYIKLAKEYRLPIRMASAGAERAIGFAGRAQADRAGVLYNDSFVMQWGKPTRGVIEDLLPRLRPGVNEFAMHPVEDTPELAAYDKTEAANRTHDYACLMDTDLRGRIEAAGIKRIGWRAIRDAMRSQ